MSRWMLDHGISSLSLSLPVMMGTGLQGPGAPAGDGLAADTGHCGIPRQSALVGAAQGSRASGIDPDRASRRT